MKLKIKVTKDIIFRSHNCGWKIDEIIKNCAVAMAICDLFPKAEVYTYDVDWTGENEKEYLSLVRHSEKHVPENKLPKEVSRLPETASDFIEKFDQYQGAPEKRLLLPEFSFEIEVPDSVIEKIGINEAIEILSKSETMEVVEG